jgi:hypothetical protein
VCRREPYTKAPDNWRNFRFILGDIQSLDTCRQACRSVEFGYEPVWGIQRGLERTIGWYDAKLAQRRTVDGRVPMFRPALGGS